MTRKIYSGTDKIYFENNDWVISRNSAFDLFVIGKHGRDIQRIPSFVADAGISILDEVLAFIKIVSRREVPKADEALYREAIEEHLKDMKEGLI